MKAILHPRDGLMLVPDEVPTDPSATYLFEDAAAPETTALEVADSQLVLGLDNIVRRVWTVRLKTDAEAQRIIDEPQSIWLQLTDQERDAIWDAASASSPSAQRSAARKVLGAIWAAPKVFTRSVTTRALCAAVSGYGWVSPERLRVVLGDSGVV